MTTKSKDRVFIFDTTLRDGEQCPGATMTFEEKLEVADLLDEMGVDIIEAGFPIASDGDFEAVTAIAKRIKNSVVAGLARAGMKDIDRAGEAVKHAARPRIHTFLSTSPVHMKYKLQKEPDEVLQMVTESVKRARNWVDDVEWSAEDGTRTEMDFLCRCVDTAIKAGATHDQHPRHRRLHHAGRVPRPVPHRARAGAELRQGDLLGALPQRPRHGGRQLAGRRRGRRAADRMHHQRHRRAGRQCRARGDRDGDQDPQRRAAVRLPASTPTMLNRASKLVSAATSFPVQYNKAIVGRNAFAHESGIHQDGMLKHTQTYEIMTPESVGVSKTSLVMGKHSGRNAFRNKLQELGYELGDNQLEDAFTRFKTLADNKKHIYDEDIEALVDEGIATATDRIKVVALIVIAGTMGPQSATLTLDIDGTEKTVQATGNGPVDATFNAIQKLVPHRAILELYQVHAVTEGTDAQAEVSVRLQEDGRTVTAKAADPDTLVASAKAYIGALNKLMIKRQRETTPQAVAGERQRLGGV